MQRYGNTFIAGEGEKERVCFGLRGGCTGSGQSKVALEGSGAAHSPRSRGEPSPAAPAQPPRPLPQPPQRVEGEAALTGTAAR